jgi:hypothetical protein
MKKVSLLVLIVFICAVLVPYFYTQLKPYFSLEGFDNYKSLENISINNISITNKYPLTENNALVQGSYKISGKNGVSRDQGSKIWWHYPIFKVGSFKQLTNNLRYYKNPDTGNCMAADFCGALYKDNKDKSNIITQLPPVEPSDGVRVNYYSTFSTFKKS